jgi:hypothetical protein
MFNQISRQEDMPRTERVKAQAIRRKKWAERAMNAYLILGPDTLLGACLETARRMFHSRSLAASRS